MPIFAPKVFPPSVLTRYEMPWLVPISIYAMTTVPSGATAIRSSAACESELNPETS